MNFIIKLFIIKLIFWSFLSRDWKELLFTLQTTVSQNWKGVPRFTVETKGSKTDKISLHQDLFKILLQGKNCLQVFFELVADCFSD